MLSRQNLYEIFEFYEEDRFYHVNNHSYYYVCVHHEPLDITVTAHETQQMWKATMTMKHGHVDMRKYSSPKGEGWAGQCKVCGKVYYR